MVYCINSSLLLYIQQKPTRIKRGLTDERKQTKGINNNFICLLGRHLITFISNCWEKQREPGLHTKIWTYNAFFPPRGHGTGPTDYLTVTAQYLGRSHHSHNFKNPCISCSFTSPALYHNTLDTGTFWVALTFSTYDIERTDCTPVVLPINFVLFFTLELFATVGI